MPTSVVDSRAVEPRDTTPPFVVLLALLSAACWGFGVVASKGALEAGLTPVPLVGLQLGASLIVLSTISAFTCAPLPKGAHARAARLAGTLEYGVTYGLAAFGIALTTAGNAAIIGSAEPAFVVLVATLLLKERVGRQVGFLLALVTGGLLLVMAPQMASVGVPGLGDLLVLGSAATGAVYAALSRRLVADIEPLPLAVLQQRAGFVVVLVGAAALLLFGFMPKMLGAISVSAIALGVLSGLLQHALAVGLHLHALKRMPAGTFAMFLATVPVFGLVAAYVALAEPIIGTQIAGGALIVAAAAAAGRVTAQSKPS